MNRKPEELTAGRRSLLCVKTRAQTFRRPARTAAPVWKTCSRGHEAPDRSDWCMDTSAWEESGTDGQRRGERCPCTGMATGSRSAKAENKCSFRFSARLSPVMHQSQMIIPVGSACLQQQQHQQQGSGVFKVEFCYCSAKIFSVDFAGVNQRLHRFEVKSVRRRFQQTVE